MFGVSSSSLFGGPGGSTGGSFFLSGVGEPPRASLWDSGMISTPSKQGQISAEGQERTPPMKKPRPESYSSNIRGHSKVANHHVTKGNEQIMKNTKVATRKPEVHTSPPLDIAHETETEGIQHFHTGQDKACMKSKDVSSVHDKVPAPASGITGSIIEVSGVKDEEMTKSIAIPHEGGEDVAVNEIFKDLLIMQKQQLSQLLPKMKASEERSEQVLDSAMLVLKDVKDYGEKLAGVKQQYSSRLSQVSSFLRALPKQEN